jgi:hypothetical protein
VDTKVYAAVHDLIPLSGVIAEKHIVPFGRVNFVTSSVNAGTEISCQSKTTVRISRYFRLICRPLHRQRCSLRFGYRFGSLLANVDGRCIRKQAETALQGRFTMAEVKDFLSPQSALTPSVAGGLIVTISLPLADAFQCSFKFVALGVSFLLGALIVLSVGEIMTRSQRALHWVLNSLMIFAVSLGVAISVDSPPKAPQPPPELKEILEPPSPRASLWHQLFGTSSAFAQQVNPSKPSPQPGTKAESRPNTDNPSSQLNKEQTEKLKQYLQEQREYQQRQQEYNRRWSWYRG